MPIFKHLKEGKDELDDGSNMTWDEFHRRVHNFIIPKEQYDFLRVTRDMATKTKVNTHAEH